MKRIILHWSAGSNVVSAIDRDHYHFIIGGAHTLNCNTGSIDVALAGMADATKCRCRLIARPSLRRRSRRWCSLCRSVPAATPGKELEAWIADCVRQTMTGTIRKLKATDSDLGKRISPQVAQDRGRSAG